MSDFILFFDEDKEKIINLKLAIEDFISQVKLNVNNLIEEEENIVNSTISESENKDIIIPENIQEVINFLNSGGVIIQKLFFNTLYENHLKDRSKFKFICLERFFGRTLNNLYYKGKAINIGRLNNNKDPILLKLIESEFDYKLIMDNIIGEIKETHLSQPEANLPQPEEVLTEPEEVLLTKQQQRLYDGISLMDCEKQKKLFLSILDVIKDPQTSLIKKTDKELDYSFPQTLLIKFFKGYSYDFNNLFDRDIKLPDDLLKNQSFINKLLSYQKVLNLWETIDSLNNEEIKKEISINENFNPNIMQLEQTLVVVADSKKEKNQELEQICGDWYIELENIDESLKEKVILVGKRLSGIPKENFLISIIERLEQGISNDEIINFLLNLDYFLDFLVELKLLILPEELFSKNLSREHITYLHHNFANGNKIKLNEDKIKDFVFASVKYAETGDKKELENIENCKYIFDADECSTFIFENGDEKQRQELLDIFHWYIKFLKVLLHNNDISSTQMNHRDGIQNLGVGGYNNEFKILLTRAYNEVKDNYKNGIKLNLSSIFKEVDEINSRSEKKQVIQSVMKYTQDYDFFTGIQILLLNVPNDINPLGGANISSLLPLYEKAIKNSSSTLETKLSKLKNCIKK